MNDGDPTGTGVARVLERELSHLRDAIAMVSGGASSRIVLVGLRFSEALLAQAREMAAEAGVRIVPLWMPDDAGADIAIERIDG